VELSGIIGEKTVALAFMNTTCSACQAEVSLLAKLAAKNVDTLAVYLVAVDVRGDRLVKTYSENYKYKVQYLLDPSFSIPPLYGFNYTPALVLLNKAGEIVYKKGGYTPADADALIEAVQGNL
jgi:thiol-disulfide isomerase/thioredoxin